MKLKFNLSDFMHQLQHLVEIESPSHDQKGTNSVADFFQAEFRELGWKVHRSNVSGGICGDVLVMRNSDAKRADFLLIGHMDTVFPLGTLKEFPFRIEGNRVRGPGVVDMKGGLLFILELARQLAGIPVDITVLLNSDEELSSPYSGALIRSWARRSRYVFVFEPARPEGALVIQRKGVAVYQIAISGRAAHAGVNPQDGVSAVSELARWTLVLEGLTDYAAGITLNMGLFSGGEAKNVVPAHARGTLDVRFTEPDSTEKVEQLMLDLSSNAREGLSAHWEQLSLRLPMNPTEKTHALCEVARMVAEREGIASVAFVETGGASDANLAAAEGSVCLDGLGPVGGKLHSSDEYFLVDSVEPRIRLARELILQLLKNSCETTPDSAS